MLSINAASCLLYYFHVFLWSTFDLPRFLKWELQLRVCRANDLSFHFLLRYLFPACCPHVWRSEGSFCELALSFLHVDPGAELRPYGLAAGAFPTEPPDQPTLLLSDLCTWRNTFVSQYIRQQQISLLVMLFPPLIQS